MSKSFVCRIYLFAEYKDIARSPQKNSPRRSRVGAAGFKKRLRRSTRPQRIEEEPGPSRPRKEQKIAPRPVNGFSSEIFDGDHEEMDDDDEPEQQVRGQDAFEMINNGQQVCSDDLLDPHEATVIIFYL